MADGGGRVLCEADRELYCNLGPLVELIKQPAKYLGWSWVESVEQGRVLSGLPRTMIDHESRKGEKKRRRGRREPAVGMVFKHRVAQVKMWGP
jgi:hypothetical protein